MNVRGRSGPLRLTRPRHPLLSARRGVRELTSIHFCPKDALQDGPVRGDRFATLPSPARNLSRGVEFLCNA